MTSEATPPQAPNRMRPLTRRELDRAALYAWGVFVVLLILGLSVVLVLSTPLDLFLTVIVFWALPPFVLSFLVAVVVGAGISAVALILALPLIWLIGYCLRRVRWAWVHLLAFAILGAALAALAMTVFEVSKDDVPLQKEPLVVTVITVISAAAMPLGWWLSSRRALRIDAQMVGVRERLAAASAAGRKAQAQEGNR